MAQQVDYPPDFEELKREVKNLLGFNTNQYKDAYLKRRFNNRLQAYNLDSYQEYWNLLKKDINEQERLLSGLTVNVTEFFRDPSVYQFLYDHVFPLMIQTKNQLRVWSAGCSDGKEAYSVAMLFLKLLGERAKSMVTIVATDIDKSCLDRGRMGHYISKKDIEQSDVSKQLSFLNRPLEFFDIKGDNYYLKQAVKDLVTFQYHDLISGSKKHHFDIIFCRNVVIYFNRPLQEMVYMDFYNALNKDGFFVMGQNETLLGESRHLFKSYDLRKRVFQKI